MTRPAPTRVTRIVATRVTPYSLPLDPPVRGRTDRRGWHLTIVDAEGRTGRGDAATWPGFGSDESALEAAIFHLGEWLPGQALSSLDGVAPQGLAPEARYALELALVDLSGGLEPAPSVYTVVVSSPDDVPAGAANLKVKVGADLDADDARLAALRAHAPDARIRIDANGRWSLSQATQAIERFAPYDLELIEQPVATLEELAQLSQRFPEVVFAADECVSNRAELEKLIALSAAQVVVIKPMFVGGLIAAERLAERARQAGLGVIITHALESNVGRRGAQHLARRVGGPWTHGVAPVPEASPTVGPATDLPATELLPTDVPNPLGGSALARPNHPAIETDGGSISYRALAAAAARYATALQALGLGPRDTIGLCGVAGLEWVQAFHGIAWLGACVAPLRADESELNATTLVLGSRSARGDVVRVVIHDRIPLKPERFWPAEEARLAVRTSGTTGQPRVVRLTTLQLLTSAFGSAIRLGHEPADRWLCALPTHHVGGLSILLRCAFMGTTVVLYERFDATRVESARATLISLVPTMLQRLLDGPGFPNTIRAALIGGGATSPELLARCEGLPVALTWGLTEAASQVATRTPGDLHPSSGNGAPLPFARVSSVNGRLVIRGPLVGGHLVSPDRGTVDAQGRVHVSGRADDVILSGGENIDPARVEAVLLGHPGVAQAAVAGVADTEWGERPHAFLVCNDTAKPDDVELRRMCREQLVGFEVPDEFHWLSELPRNELGKLMRRRLVDGIVPSQRRRLSSER